MTGHDLMSSRPAGLPRAEALALIDRLETEVAQRQRLLVELRQALVWESPPTPESIGAGIASNTVLRRARQRRNLTQAGPPPRPRRQWVARLGNSPRDLQRHNRRSYDHGQRRR